METKKAASLKKVESPLAEKKSMVVEDLFLLHTGNYRLISHVTNRKVDDETKKEIFSELKMLRSFMRHNSKYRPGELNVLRFSDKTALIDAGDNAA
ncbi:MAG: hypothetical protein R6U27_05340, partial [Desulfobacterales bacterium]